MGSFFYEWPAVALVLFAHGLWWIGRPVWNVIVTLAREIGKVVGLIFKHLFRLFIRVLPVGGAITGAWLAITGIGQGNGTLIANGAVLALGVGALVPVVWSYYNKHSGTGFGGIDDAIASADDDSDGDAVEFP